jgi:hypothetical protein
LRDEVWIQCDLFRPDLAQPFDSLATVSIGQYFGSQPCPGARTGTYIVKGTISRKDEWQVAGAVVVGIEELWLLGPTRALNFKSKTTAMILFPADDQPRPLGLVPPFI